MFTDVRPSGWFTMRSTAVVGDSSEPCLRCVSFQIAAMQAGLLKVVPQAVLDLLTWQEVEKKVCGDPEITVEAIKRLSEWPADVNADIPWFKVITGQRSYICLLKG